MFHIIATTIVSSCKEDHRRTMDHLSYRLWLVSQDMDSGAGAMPCSSAIAQTSFYALGSHADATWHDDHDTSMCKAAVAGSAH